MKDVRVPDSAILHKEGEGLVVAQRFVHENRVRQAAASAGAARYCILEAVKYSNARIAFGEPLAKKQGVQFPLVELWADYQLLRNFIFRTAWQMDRQNPLEISDMVSICNFRANRLCLRGGGPRDAGACAGWATAARCRSSTLPTRTTAGVAITRAREVGSAGGGLLASVRLQRQEGREHDPRSARLHAPSRAPRR